MELVHSHAFTILITTAALTRAVCVNLKNSASGMSSLLELIEPWVPTRNMNCYCENSEQDDKSVQDNIPGSSEPRYIYSKPAYSSGSSYYFTDSALLLVILISVLFSYLLVYCMCRYSMASSEEEHVNHQHHDIPDTLSREAVVAVVSLTAIERMRIPLSLSVPPLPGETHLLVELARNETILETNSGQVQPPAAQTTISLPVQEDLPPSYFSATKDPPPYSTLEAGVKQ